MVPRTGSGQRRPVERQRKARSQPVREARSEQATHQSDDSSAEEWAPQFLAGAVQGSVPLSHTMATALQHTVGNQAVARLVQREGPTVPTTPTRTTRDSVDAAAEGIYSRLNIGGLSSRKEEEILHLLLLNYDRAADIRASYERQYRKTLNADLALMDKANELRAREYLLVGRLRPITKVAIAMEGIGTSEGTIWRVLPEAAPTAVADWVAMKRDHAGVRMINGLDESLYEALDWDFDLSDLDKAWALARFGQLRPEDKIRIATNQAGTDLTMLWDGLRSANPATIGASYEAAYNENLESLLFDQVDEYGEAASSGELSSHDAEYARSLLGVTRSGPDRLVTLATQLISGSNDFSLLLSAIQQDSPTPAQLARLKTAVENDTLGLSSWGGLSSAELAQLKAVLGIRETSTDVSGGSAYMDVETLNDPLVVALRAKGGVEYGSILPTMLKYTRAEIEAVQAAFRNDHSHFKRYVSANSNMSHTYTELPVVVNGTLWSKLNLCCGGLRDDYEDYAVHVVSQFATPEQKAELAQAFRDLDEGREPAGAAARAATNLSGAFSTTELNKVRERCDDRPMGILGTAAALEERTARERSELFDVMSGSTGESAALGDERRELRTGIHSSLLDGSISAAEATRLGASARRTSEAISEYAAARDEFAGYASTAINVAIGLLIAAGTGGAAGPAVVAAIMRSAAAMAVARVVTEKAIRGDRFDIMGADGARAFVAGAADGVMNVVGAGAAAGVLERIGAQGARSAIETGSAGLGLRLVNETLNGGMSGGVGGVVDSVTNESTWANGVTAGVRTTVTNAASSAAQGAVTSAVITGGTAALGRGGGAPHAGGEPNGHAGTPGEGPAPAHGDGPNPAHGESPNGPHGDAPGGAHVPGDGSSTTRSGGSRSPETTAPRLDPSDPILARVHTDDAACAEVVRRFGVWEHGIAALRNQTGIAAGLEKSQALAIMAALQRHRERLVAHLGEQFNAHPAAIASNNPESDMDLNVRGDTAGASLINARTYLDANFPGWQRRYRMALMVGAERITTVSEVMSQLSAGERTALRRELSREVEALTIGRRLRGVQDPAQRAELLAGLDTAHRDMAEGFSLMDEAALRTRHDAALQAGDEAMRNYRAATTPEDRVRWAKEVTRQQMIANSMGSDAYVSVASVEAFVAPRTPAEMRAALRRMNPSSQYDVLVDQVDMMAHQIHDAGGVIPALRRYELYKYIERFCATLEAAGVADSQIAYFKNLADLHYRVDRGASATTRGPIGPDGISGGHADASVRVDEGYMAGRSEDGPSDQFLLGFWNEFRPWANAQSAAMRGRAMGEGAPGSSTSGSPTPAGTAGSAGSDAAGTAGAGGVDAPRPVAPVPAATAADAALAARPTEPVAGPVLDGATPAGGARGHGPGLPGATANRPIGRGIDNLETARAVLDRLRRGDSLPLRGLGVDVPEGFNPAGREWGIGQRPDGTCVLVYGDTSEVNWRSLLAEDIRPVAHSHPIHEGRQITAGKTVDQIITGGGADSTHVLPSAEDVVFTRANQLDHHDVYTPYTVDPSGRVYNPGATGPDGNALPGLTFRIADVSIHGRVGDSTNGYNVLSALLIATDVQGNVHFHGRIYVSELLGGVMLGRSIPESLGVRPIGAAGTGGAAGSGAGSDDDGRH